MEYSHSFIHLNSLYFCLSFLFIECVYLLLAHGAPVKVKNNFGWSPLAEAISYGDRQISKFFWLWDLKNSALGNLSLALAEIAKCQGLKGDHA